MTLAQLLAPSDTAPAAARRPGRPRVDSDPSERLKHLAAASAVLIHGRSVARVARQFDVTPQTVRNWIRLARSYEGPSADVLRMVAPLSSITLN